MTEQAASWQDELLPPATGTFRTSWREVYAEWFGPFVVGMTIASALILFDGGDSDILLGVITFMGAAGAIFLAVRYRMLGTRSVEITTEAITARPFVGPEVHIERNELTEAWQHKKWRLISGGKRITIREYGFSTEEWVDLSFALYAWQDTGAVETMPGVLARPTSEREEDAPDVAVYEAQHNPALWWSVPVLASMGILAILLSVPSYQDGTWMEDPGVTVFAPLFFCAIVIFFLFGLPRLVRRATFLPSTLIIERYVGEPRIIPYEDILDAHDKQINTRTGRFVLGERNARSFHRLLYPHLKDGQLNGKLGLRYAFEMHYLIYAIVAGMVLGFIASVLLSSMFDLSEEWAEVISLAVLMGCVGLASLAAYMMARRELKRGADL